MRPEDAIRLTHLIDAGERALEFVENRRREDLESDLRLAFALTRAIEIFGEAASRVEPDTRRSLTQIPWVPIIGMRNRVVHAYFEINLNVI
jgi:uncharacterized protein with HEPN domain